VPADRTIYAGVVLALLLTGCGTAAAPQPTAPTTRDTPPRPDPVTACAQQLTYWAEQDLRGAPDQGFDYQERGLTGAQADALADLVAQARTQGDALPPDWVAGQARERCVTIVDQPPNTGGSWP
jgi:hypothetical protein